MKSRKTHSLVEEFVQLLYIHNWDFSDAPTTDEWYEGMISHEAIRKVMSELHKRGITEHELKTIFNEFAPDKYKYKGF
jgi:microsomal dipeptidase-like Zn-dependent dipeptidase